MGDITPERKINIKAKDTREQENQNQKVKRPDGESYLDNENILRKSKSWLPDSKIKADEFDPALLARMQRKYPNPNKDNIREIQEWLDNAGGWSEFLKSNKMQKKGAPETQKYLESLGIDLYGKRGNGGTTIIQSSSMGIPSGNDAKKEDFVPEGRKVEPKKESEETVVPQTDRSSVTKDIMAENAQDAKAGLDANKNVDPEFMEYASAQASDVNSRYDDLLGDIHKYMRSPLVLYLLGANAGKKGEWDIKERWKKDKIARNLHYLLNSIGTVAQRMGASALGQNPLAYESDYRNDMNKMVGAYQNRVNSILDSGATAASNLIGKQATSNQEFANMPRKLSAEAMKALYDPKMSAEARREVLKVLREMGADLGQLSDEEWNDLTKALIYSANGSKEAAEAAGKVAASKNYNVVADYVAKAGGEVQKLFKWALDKVNGKK